ncbi:RING-type E3 ubiquitin transferase HRD1 [Hyphodiscus hymeniophilus]|uniref:RING-type E3 ubiquitin transferase n=1 Tax=Hyphodiscus hymeniophilus TaxID=353542 RepID=A0A9P7AV12_9HELO|nr:RING-type E3 ubiquitin transferase HRD1 [Hyphodiscus hymeniophilus]
MGRLHWYAGVSTALAAGVIVSAFNQRANFYSACVYLAQSNLCLMILINLILFIYGSFMYGLQRLCYGALRPIEIEQLYEKAWFAITETCLAMTIFREEVGAWFLVMFVALLTGKVWGWIGDGRVEILEQQPPTNPRLFHIRLSISLAASILYDCWLMSYIINTVIQQARPNMMVMFLFEFAILTSSSFSTACRYCISLVEAKVVRKQTHDRLIERRREVREERLEMARQREAAIATAAAEGNEPPQFTEALPSEDDVEEMDIEVPGWEAKGQYVLSLDLATDFVKLGIYLTFFFILLMFYGLPIHIMRDLFMTTRSFVKRLTAFIRYRRATQDMNAKYEDATVADIEREDTCIICREEMRPWSVTNPQAPPAAPGALPPARPAATANERSRPKKLPCGHILHLGCLKSWLERQQVCPTCRRSVTDTSPQVGQAPGNNANPAVPAAPAAAPGQQNGPGAPPPPAARAGRGLRMLNFGPIRVGFGQANLQDMAHGLGAQENGVAGNARVYGLELGFPRRQRPQPQPQLQPQPQAQGANLPVSSNLIQDHLRQIEQQISAEIRQLQLTQQELQLVQLLQVELNRIRLMQDGVVDPIQMTLLSQNRQPTLQPQMQRHGARPNTTALPAGSADLPPGVVIPEGWSLLPLQRLEGPSTAPVFGVTPAGTVPASGPAAAPTATTNPTVTSPTNGTSNNTPSPTPTIDPDNNGQASADSLDTNVIHTLPSITAHQSTAQDASPQDTTLPSITTRNGGTAPSTQASSGPPASRSGGLSQLFAAGGNSANTDLQQDAPPSTEELRAARQRALINTANADGSPSTSAGMEARQETEPRTEEKGKGRTVSVEDVEDEAEGS